MKKLQIVVLLLLAGLLSAQGQVNSQQTLTSKVEAVTLYFGGAQVTRTASANIQPGTTTLILRGLPSTIDVSTYAVEGKGNFTILSIMDGTINRADALPKEAFLINDSITKLQLEKENIEIEQTILKEEENFLNLNRSIGGQQQGITAAEFKQMHEMYKARFASVKKEQLKNKRKIEQINKDLQKLRDRLYPFTSERVSLNQELSITVLASQATKADISVSYYTRAAGWEPSYDIRGGNTSNRIDLVLKASARNVTGENWEGTKFTFSTGQPALNATPPAVYPWYLRPVLPAPVYNAAPKRALAGAYTLEAREMIMFDEEAEEEAFTSADFIAKDDAMLATDYSIPMPYSLPTGKDPLTLELEKSTLSASYEHVMIPKLSNHAYLSAAIPNSEGINLLSAKTSIFLDGAYMGSGYISSYNATDTINLPIGVDAGVLVKRTRVKEFTSKKMIGGKVTETIGWELELINQRNAAITYNLKDQIPVSTDKNIVVKVENLDGGHLVDHSGIITWKAELAARQTKKIRFSYSVTYPKDMKIVLE